MDTKPLELNSVNDIVEYIPQEDFKNRSRLDKEKIRNGSLCNCEKGNFTKSKDTYLYEGEKKGIAICNDCNGYYGIFIPNWR